MNKDKPSETDLINFIRAAPQDYPSSLVQQIGDDCAVFETASADRLVVTTDLLLEDVHFRKEWISPYLLGRKSLLVNLSDVVAMGAAPYACLLSLGLPGNLTGDYFKHFVNGFLQECRRSEMPLVGGDLSNSSSIVVSVTAWGHLNSGAPLCRSGARAGDHVLLVGRTGYARLGLEYLEQIETEGLASISDEAELARWAGMAHCYEWLKSFFLPEIHAEAASWIAENGLAHSMIDVSDGLGQDLLHILEESQLSGEIELTRLSYPIGVEDRKRAREYALNGGEDYALLFTVSEEQLEILKKDYPQDFTPFTIIGRLFTGPAALYLVDEDGRKSEYQPEGFHHFP